MRRACGSRCSRMLRIAAGVTKPGSLSEMACASGVGMHPAAGMQCNQTSCSWGMCMHFGCMQASR